jgi:hypothetical protein
MEPVATRTPDFVVLLGGEPAADRLLALRQDVLAEGA